MTHIHRPISRRTLLRSGAGAAALASMTRSPAFASARLQESPVRGGTLIIGTAQQIQTLDPHKGGLRNNRNSWVGLFSFLTRYDDDGVPVPALAESWETAADGLSWTFRLRPG